MKINRLFAFWAIAIALFVCLQSPTQAANLTQFDNKAAFSTTGAFVDGRSEMTDKPPAQDILIVKGKKFPKVAPIAGARSTSSCCNLGDTRFVPGQAVIDISLPKNTKKNKYTAVTTAPYSPPMNCWVIAASQRVVNSATIGNYTASMSAVPANYSFVTSSQYQQVHQDLKNYVLNLNILDKYKVDINANLSDFVKNYGDYAASLSTSHGSVIHTAQVQGAGLGNGRSWYNAHVNTSETCCPPEIRNASDLKTTLKTWIDQRVANLPRIIDEPHKIDDVKEI